MSESTEKLLRQAFDARREHRLDDAKRDLVRAVDLSRVDAVPLDMASAVTRLGAIERDLGNRDVALQHYAEALAIYRTEGQTLRIAHSVRHIGDIHHEMGRADLAEPCYLEALNIYRAYDDPPSLDFANTIRGFALLKSEAGDKEQARRLWTEARDLYKKAGVDAGVDECSERLAFPA